MTHIRLTDRGRKEKGYTWSKDSLDILSCRCGVSTQNKKQVSSDNLHFCWKLTANNTNDISFPSNNRYKGEIGRDGKIITLGIWWFAEVRLQQRRERTNAISRVYIERLQGDYKGLGFQYTSVGYFNPRLMLITIYTSGFVITLYLQGATTCGVEYRNGLQLHCSDFWRPEEFYKCIWKCSN